MADREDLVIPFVTVSSRGGPHDNDSYNAGFAMGQLFVWLSSSNVRVYEVPVRKENVQQADMMAMALGWDARVGGQEGTYLKMFFIKRPEVDVEHLAMTLEGL